MTAGQRLGIGALAAVLAISLIGAPYPQDTLLQHVPTVLVLLCAPFLLRRWPLGDAAVLCLGLFVLLHIIGARWIYSYVPYDEWARLLTGEGLTQRFGWSRNHYDRLVHFAYGALLVLPLREVMTRHLGIAPRLTAYIAVEFVLATSLSYEVFEWPLTIVLSPGEADAYNGQQGDIWDAQKDMAAAFVGALAASMIATLRHARPT